MKKRFSNKRVFKTSEKSENTGLLFHLPTEYCACKDKQKKLYGNKFENYPSIIAIHEYSGDISSPTFLVV